MSGPSSEVVLFRPLANADQERRMRPKVASRRPPAHLHAAAKLAWTDIVGLQGRGAQGSDAELAVAAVLLASFRAGAMSAPLVTQMNAALEGLGLSRGARARLRD
jgi:hypothetical protein